MSNRTTWREEFTAARQDVGDWSSVVHVAPNDDVLDVRFNGGFGISKGPHFLIWTEHRVYFPAVYDGAEWIGSAPRNPIEDGQGHVGGE